MVMTTAGKSRLTITAENIWYHPNSPVVSVSCYINIALATVEADLCVLMAITISKTESQSSLECRHGYTGNYTE